MQNNNPKVSNILTLACKVTGKRITLPEKDLMQAGTILIVDDNKSVLTSLELLLEDEFEMGWRLPRTRTVSFRSWTVGRLILSCWI